MEAGHERLRALAEEPAGAERLGDPLRRELDAADDALALDGGEDRGDIYNGGAALSEEALRAYVEARGNEYLFLRRDVEVKSLHPELLDRFVFPMQSLRLVMAISPQSQGMHELFVFIGRALFRGFEKTGGLGVYEMVSRESPFFTLLAQHHVSGWLREYESGNEPPSGEWQPVLLGPTA